MDTRFAIASATKRLTALAVTSLVDDGLLELSTPARSLPRRRPAADRRRVTVEHLLSHRSGIGDYFDGDALADHRLRDGGARAPADPRRATWRSCDGLPGGVRARRALLLLQRRLRRAGSDCRAGQRCALDDPSPSCLEPAGMVGTAFLRSDELPGAALGYLTADGLRTNVFHLPVLGIGDGGTYSTAADLHPFLAGAVRRARSCPARPGRPRCLGRAQRPGRGVPPLRAGVPPVTPKPGCSVGLEGYDAGVSFSEHRTTRDTATHANRDLEHVRWRLADRAGARRIIAARGPECSDRIRP